MSLTVSAEDYAEITGTKATVSQARVWREFDSLVDRNAPRWASRAGSILTGEGVRAAEAYESHGERAAIAAVDDDQWFRYIERLWISVVPDAGKVIAPFLEKGMKVVTDPLVQAAINWVKANGVREAGMISNASRKGIQEQIRIGISKGETDEQIAARIRKKYRSIKEARSETIARTEVHAASNYGSLSAATETKIPMKKIWVDTPDDRTRDAHVSAGGQSKPLDQPFIVDGERLMHPGDSSLGASAENLVNCRCHLFFEVARRRLPVPARRPAAA